MPKHDYSPSIEVLEYLDALWLQRGLSENTLAAYRRDLTQTEHWLLKLRFERSDLRGYVRVIVSSCTLR